MKKRGWRTPEQAGGGPPQDQSNYLPAGEPSTLLRHEWQPNSKTAQEIEAAVAKILSDPAQAKLAEQQMSNK